MKKGIIKLSGVLCFAALLLSLLADLPLTEASSTPIVFIDPPKYEWNTNTVPPKFNVTVWINSSTDFELMMFQVRIEYDHRYINISKVLVAGKWVLRAWPNSKLKSRTWDPQYVFYSKDGIHGDPYYEYVATDKGAVTLGDQLLEAITVPGNTNFKVACFEFEVIAWPGKGESLESLLNINVPETYFFDSTGAIEVEKRNGYYKLNWAKPGPAYFDIERADGKAWPLILERWFNWTGQTFVTSVYIKDLSPAWGITGANFTLNYDSALISTCATNVTIDPLWTDYTIDDSVSGALFIEVRNPPSGTGGDKVHIADINFTVIYQAPEYPVVNETYLVFSSGFMWDHIQLIDTKTPGRGHVVIEGYLAIPLSWFEIYQPDPILQGAHTNDTVIGPAPSVDKIFEVQIKINNLHPKWFTVAWQCRLFYDPTLIEFVEAVEGPFLKDPRWNWYGTIFACNGFLEPPSWVVPFPGPHVAIGCLLLPNLTTSEYDQTEFPNTINPPIVDNTLATLKFRVKKQLWPQNLSCVLGLTGLSTWLLKKDGTSIPVDEEKTVNGTVTILGSPLPGRMVDLYGGANNAGHGVVNAPFPVPYGGQGPNAPMDLVIPQSEVYLFAKVTYNFWPVQSKLVNFEIEGPYEKNATTGELVKKRSWKVWAKLTAVTNGSGIASIVYRMPWVCEDPWNNVVGIWKITATCNLYDKVVTDTMIFYYENLLNITKVTTDKYNYVHGEVVVVTVKYATHSMQTYNATFAITLTDEVGVPIAMVLKEVIVGGAEFCTLKEDSFTVGLEIPKWAAAGYAYVHVNCYDKDPTEGGFAWCPEYTPPPEIYIMPV